MHYKQGNPMKNYYIDNRKSTAIDQIRNLATLASTNLRYIMYDLRHQKGKLNPTLICNY